MSSFPPPSIAVHTEAIVDNCEVAEMTPGSDPAVPVIELAALLYLGEYIHARHLWRRYSNADGGEGGGGAANNNNNAIMIPAPIKAALTDWWALGRALMQQNNMTEIWSRLNHLKQNQPKPYCDYAVEVEDAVRRRLIPKLMKIWSSSPQDSNNALLLGLPRQDWLTFLEKNRHQIQGASSSSSGGRDMSETISYFESPSLTV